MSPEGRGRFCTGCGRFVHRVAEYTPEEVEALLAPENEPACVRVEPMADGSARARVSSTGRRLLTAALTSALSTTLATGTAAEPRAAAAPAPPLPVPPVKAPVGQGMTAPVVVEGSDHQARSRQLGDSPGRAFRDRLHRPLPGAAELVILHAVAAHLTRAEGSIVAWSDAAGVWRAETLSEVTSLAPPPPGSTGPQRPVEQPLSERALTSEETRKRRAMLDDPGLYTGVEENAESSAPPIGAAEHEMEIISRSGRRRFGWASGRVGKAGAIADMILR